MTFQQTLLTQFGKPQGALGRLAGLVMANRPSNRARNEWTVELLELSSTDHVLEIGCGPGLALAATLARVPYGRVLGIDHSDVMIRQARHRNRRAIASGALDLLVGGLDQLDGIAPRFDKIYWVNVVQFLPDKVAAFKSLRSVLRPGGRCATTHMPRLSGANRAAAIESAVEITQSLEAAGFIDIRTEELPLEPVPAMCVIGHRPRAEARGQPGPSTRGGDRQ